MTTPPTGPTAEDLSRDLAADLELCDEVTQRPQGSWPSRRIYEQFVTTARTGWPTAIRRALHGEDMLRYQHRLYAAEASSALERIRALEQRVKEQAEHIIALESDLAGHTPRWAKLEDFQEKCEQIEQQCLELATCLHEVETAWHDEARVVRLGEWLKGYASFTPGSAHR